MLRLTITAGDRVRHVALHHDGPLSIGASADNAIVVDAVGVSRHHARVERTAGGVLIVDAGSKNGIVLGGRRVKDATLVPGDAVRIGAASLLVEEIATSDADIALRIDESSATGTALVANDTETAGIASGPVAALQWVRLAEQRTPREIAHDLTELLEIARIVVGAEALLLVEAADDDLAVLAVAGPLPKDAEARDLARGTSAAWMRAGRLVARITPAARSAWKREFLEFVNVKLSDASGAAPAQRKESDVRLPPEMVAGTSTCMRALVSDIARIAHGTIDVLVVGETGTGKELVARAIHLSSPRSRGPFVAVNCAAVARELLEAELFGIGRAVATGVDARPGLFAAANGGTIFLDEIGEMPLALQPKLLRVLQEREVLPVGATKPRTVDARVVSSTNRDLAALVASGAFRADLYYRLRGIELRIPSLRMRREDIPALTHAFARSAAEGAHKHIRGISRKALVRLLEYEWPGNVRELRNTVEAAIVRCPEGGSIQESHLGLHSSSSAPSSHVSHAQDSPLTDRLESVERDAILSAIARCGGNKSRAARLLGITRAGLYAKMKRHGIR